MTTCNTEIRKLRPKELFALANTLSPDSWKILMAAVPKPESPDLPLFTSEHFT